MTNRLKRVSDKDRIDPHQQLRNYAEWLRANTDTRAYIGGTKAEREATRNALIRMGIAANRIVEVD